MTDEMPGAPAPEDGDHAEADAPPRGTMVLMLLFLAAIVVMWSYVYFLMLGRA